MKKKREIKERNIKEFQKLSKKIEIINQQEEKKERKRIKDYLIQKRKKKLKNK